MAKKKRKCTQQEKILGTRARYITDGLAYADDVSSHKQINIIYI
jgi:hypothetical protein